MTRLRLPAAAGRDDDEAIVFRFILISPDDEPYEPPTFLTASAHWSVGDEIVPGHSGHARILDVDTECTSMSARWDSPASSPSSRFSTRPSSDRVERLRVGHDAADYVVEAPL